MSKDTGPKPTETVVTLKASPEWLSKVEEWRRAQPNLLNRSEAIRRLVTHGLAYFSLMKNTGAKK